ncbi:MAG: hypothetical protein M1825_006103 [Sarcosagium campestre]|nr:MAG: hypothetical protein M1825_006103 [Sarcosagium campestre]
MDEKEIHVRIKALNKAAATGEPPETVLQILQGLKAGVVPTEDLLRSTKVGVVVNRQKQNTNKEVARLAGEIVSKWRDDVKSKGIAQKKGTASGSKAPNGDAGVKSPNAAKITVPPTERTWKKDGVDPKRTGNDIRDSCIGLIYDGLCFSNEETPTLVLKCAVDIERAAMGVYGSETESAYKAKIRSLFQNLKNRSSAELRTRVLSGDITPQRLVVMTHDELRSTERKAEDERIAKENMNNAMVAHAELSISDSLTCGKCQQKKVSYSQAQTRSADEPMTTFCECQVCGHRWKVSSSLWRNPQVLCAFGPSRTDARSLVLLNARNLLPPLDASPRGVVPP